MKKNLPVMLAILCCILTSRCGGNGADISEGVSNNPMAERAVKTAAVDSLPRLLLVSFQGISRAFQQSSQGGNMKALTTQIGSSNCDIDISFLPAVSAECECPEGGSIILNFADVFTLAECFSTEDLDVTTHFEASLNQCKVSSCGEAITGSGKFSGDVSITGRFCIPDHISFSMETEAQCSGVSSTSSGGNSHQSGHVVAVASDGPFPEDYSTAPLPSKVSGSACADGNVTTFGDLEDFYAAVDSGGACFNSGIPDTNGCGDCPEGCPCAAKPSANGVQYFCGCEVNSGGSGSVEMCGACDNSEQCADGMMCLEGICAYAAAECG